MTTSEPKNILIHNIAAIDDESFLQAIKTIIDIKTQTTVYKTTNQHKALGEEGIEQIEKGDYFFNEKVAEEIEKMASRKIIWSVRAKFDQLKILDFYYQINGTKTYSLKLYSNFKSAVKLIGKQPEIGLKTDNVNVRNLIVGYFALFYRINEQSIENIAIWDSRQDPENLKL